MKITNTTDYIRQQHLGQFRRPEDAQGPFAYVKDQRLESTKEQKESSVYINNENVGTLEKEERSNSPKLFDFDAAVKFSTQKTSETNKQEKLHQKYDKTAKAQVVTKQESLVDQWS